MRMYKDENSLLFNGDCLDVMEELIKRGIKVDAIITSPPYDDIKDYKGTCVWNFEVFKNIARKMYVLLNEGGSIIWVVGDKTKHGSETLTSFRQAIYFNQLGLKVHDTMIYRKLNYTPLTHRRYEQEFEYIFCFVKGKLKTFNPIKIPCKYAGTETWGKPSYYKNTNDELTQTKKKRINDMKIKGNIFEYKTGSTKTGKIKHPAVFPLDLAKDMTKSWTNINDTVLDLFMGSGTTGVACKDLGRRFIGIEKVADYYNIAKERITNQENEKEE